MPEEIRVLLVEDDPHDAELIIDTLRGAEFNLQWQRVDTEADFLRSLNTDPDIVLSDLEMPGFSGLRALELLKEQRPEIPFILVSGVIGEEQAVAAMRLGATDYLLKDKLQRLELAVRQALEKKRLSSRYACAERALIEGDQKFRALFNAANDPIYMIRDGIFVDCNSKGANIYGRTRDQIMGHSPVEFAPPFQPDGRESLEKATGIFHEALEGKPQLFEWTSLHADGTPIYSDVSLNRLELGGQVYLMAIARDVTDRKHAQAKIAEQAALLDQARDAIILRSIDGTLLFWNHGAERVYGWTRKEVMGCNALQILRTHPKAFEELNEFVMTRGEWHGQLDHVTKDGRHIAVEVNCTLIRDEQGHPKSVLSINTDITEKNKIESQLMRVQRMESVDALAGGIAHDLNNILAPIMLSISLLKSGPPEPQAKKILDSIESSAKRGANIVKQLLTFARGVEGQRIEVQIEPALRDLENIIKDAFPKNIALSLSIPDHINPILGDPTQLHQILLNLCLNARDAMPDGGTLEITAEDCTLDEECAATRTNVRAGHYVSISVTDSGTGIPEGILGKVFDPFFTTKEVTKGTGLGLSIALAIAKNHGGFIDVGSGPGPGTTFKLFLPAMEGLPDAGKQKSGDGIVPRGNNELILIVDDEASILTVTSETLEAFGYRTITAGNGKEALAVHEQLGDEISAVLTDMAMPIMDGPATIRALLQVDPNLKIIASSGLATNESICLALKLGSKSFISKPYSAEALLRTLRFTLDDLPAHREPSTDTVPIPLHAPLQAGNGHHPAGNYLA